MKTQVEIKDEIALLKLKELAIINKLKKTKPDLINLAINIASNCYKYLDEESFEQVTNIKIK